MEDSYFTLNVENIMNDNDLPSVVRMLAMKIYAKGHMNIGECLKSISTIDLMPLVDIDFEDPDEEKLHALSLISLLMNFAEGGEIGTSDDEAESQLAKLLNTTATFLTMEALARRGLVELNYNNLSFDPAVGSRVVVRATDEGLDLAKMMKDSRGSTGEEF